MAGKVLECQPLVQNSAAELACKGAGAFFIGFGVERPYDPAPQSRHGGRLHNDTVATRRQLLDFPASLRLVDRDQAPLLNLQMIDRAMSRCAPTGGIVGLHRETESRLRAFLLSEQAIARCDSHRSDG